MKKKDNPVDPYKLAEKIQGLVNDLHDSAVSDEPFKWSDSEKDRKDRSEIFSEAERLMSGYRHISKKGTVLNIFLFGTVLPLCLVGILYWLNIPPNQDMQFWVWGGLCLTAIVSAVVAACVASNPSVDEDLMFAAYTIPKGWSFSRMNPGRTWEKYRKKFPHFNVGDQNQGIVARVWGYMDEGRKRPFQMFRFYYEEVRYETVVYTDSKGNIRTRTERKVYSYNSYGMFLAVPESKVRFRISENSGDGGLDKHIRLEYKDLNKAAEVHCSDKDELAVRKFLSPAVQEKFLELSDEVEDMTADFYPGFVLLLFNHDLFGNFSSTGLNENSAGFRKDADAAAEELENLRKSVDRIMNEIRKYNDNY